MEGATLGLLSGGSGGSSGGSTNESTVSKVDVVEQDQYVDAASHPVESELELGLGLSLGVGGCGGAGGGGGGGKGKANAWGECRRILIAKDFPSVLSHAHRGANASGSSAAAVSGTKRAADSSPQEGGSPTGGSQVVGWPPIGVHRMNSLVNQTKALKAVDDKSAVVGKDKSKDVSKKKICNGKKTNIANEKGHVGFVKVNMDGVPIGRKVDLNAHACYETLAQTLEDMFFRSNPTLNSVGSVGDKEQAKETSKLLDGSSGFVLTYEDKEGDWMLVGDVPWGMFHSSIKRLRIMKTSESSGLGM